MKNLFVLFIIMISCFDLRSQPSNDECNGAIEITSGTYDVNLTNATYSGVCDIDCMLTLNSGNMCAHDVWYTFTFSDSMTVYFSANLTFGLVYFELYSGSCADLELLQCGNALGFNQKLPSGAYYLKISMQNAPVTYLDVDICPDVAIDPIMDVNACERYILPPISGSNLSGNEAYYTGSLGTGTKYLPGEEITFSGTLYAYDNTGTTASCAESQSFTIDIDVGGATIIPFYGGEWFDPDTWLFFPDACDNVIVHQNLAVWVNGIHTNTARCKTLEVVLGTEFAVFIGGQLQVGD